MQQRSRGVSTEQRVSDKGVLQGSLFKKGSQPNKESKVSNQQKGLKSTEGSQINRRVSNQQKGLLV